MQIVVRFSSSPFVWRLLVVAGALAIVRTVELDTRMVNTFAPEASAAEGETAPQEGSVEAPPDDSDDPNWAPIRKEDLRYAGRTFADWRRQLLTDLEPETQEAAIEAIEAFGLKGYECEAAAVLGQVLMTKAEQVRWRAFNALSTIGPKSVPVLADALSKGNPEIKRSAARALAHIGPRAKAVLDPLRQAIQNEDRSVRLAAAAALARIGAGEDRLLPAFEQLAGNADVDIRREIVAGLSQAGQNHPRLLPLFLRKLDDDDWQTRQAAGTALVRSAPADREVIEALTELARQDIERVRLRQSFDATTGGFLRTLSHEDKNLETAAPVLAAAASILLVDRVYANWEVTSDVLNGLSRLGPKGADAAPALAQFISIGPTDESLMLAIDILRMIGPPAREAVPALKAWVGLPEQGPRDARSIERCALKALRSIGD